MTRMWSAVSAMLVSGRPLTPKTWRPARFALPMVRFLGHHVLTVRTPIGRKVQPKFVHHAAPLIRVKLKHLDAWTEARRRNVGIYRENLPDATSVELPWEAPDSRHVYNQFVVRSKRRAISSGKCNYQRTVRIVVL